MEATIHVPIDTGPRSRYLRAYTEAGQRGPELLASLLPPKSDPDYVWVLAELVQLDLEQSSDAEKPYRLVDYKPFYPELFEDPVLLRQLAQDEFRRLCKTDESLTIENYAKAVGLSPSSVNLPGLMESTPLPRSSKPVLQGHATHNVPIKPVLPSTEHVEFDEDYFLPNSQKRQTDSTPPKSARKGRFPRVNEEFLGFRLISELGTGAFARVFLAEQIGLSNRQVALKVTNRPTREPQRLAKLRHTNVVPIYSVHDDAAPLQAVCMPFLGRQTLADLLKVYRTTGTFPHTSVHANSTANVLGPESTVRSENLSKPGSGTHNPASIVEGPWPERARLGATTHVELVLWLLIRMTEGLAHAHDMGILHLDLKPGNVLFADDGEPLLLDFNLSFDRKAHDRERAGGTLPYMAPEQLEEYRNQGDGPPRVDERTDLFALGVMAFELLSGRLPFPLPSEKPLNLTKLADDRWKGPPSLRALNQEVSFAVESIILKLLDPDPANRYQTARDLLEDLHRQRDQRPLKFAANRSWKELFNKWRKRNPGLTMYFCLSLALVACGTFGIAVYKQRQAQLHSEVVLQTRAIQDSLVRLRVDLTSRDDPKIRLVGRTLAVQILNVYGVPNQTLAYLQHPIYGAMTADERTNFRRDLTEICLLMAHSEWMEAIQRPSQRTEAMERSLRWNNVAASCLLDGDTVPRSLSRQREILLAVQSAKEVPTSSPASLAELDQLDLYLWAAEFMAVGKYVEALPMLEELTVRNANHFAGHFALGICQQQVGNPSLAIMSYRVAQALMVHDPRPTYNRGMLYLSKRDYLKAENEFTESLKRSPDHAISNYHRAIARCKQNKHELALEDINQALAGGTPQIQGLLLRAQIHLGMNQRDKAKEDLQLADSIEPGDAMDFLARGTSRIGRNPQAAYEDLLKATELNAQYYVAWQNLAHVLGDKLNQPEKALDAQSKAVELAPDFAPSRAGRAVLLARMDRVPQAHDDAERALVLSEEPTIVYQACCVYAITAQKHREDIPRAIALFRQALRVGYRDFRTIETDPDLKAIRQNTEFQAALKAAKELVK